MKKLSIFAIAGLPLIAVAASSLPPEPGTIGAEQARQQAAASKPSMASPVAYPSPGYPVIPAAPVPPIASAAPAGGQPPALYFTNPELKLNAQEREALAIAKKWKAGSSTQGLKPVAGADGVIRFLYGATQPSIICAVLQVCDVELQPGERVNTIHLGDMARWTVEPAVTGQGGSEVQHLIIKPMDSGLETSLMVTTDRRAYHLRLRSHRTEYMPRVAFTYPDEAMAKWEAVRQAQARSHERQVLPGTGEYLGDLNFDYAIEGSSTSWKPVRVYNDGVKTIIQMPATLSQADAPILLVVKKDGGIFTDEESVQVNYRLQGNRYIVDSIFEKAILVAGVGSTQDRITIRRGK
jgi:type IV secretion system protein VirB9